MSQNRASFHYINIVISMGPGQQASTQLHHHITQNYRNLFTFNGTKIYRRSFYNSLIKDIDF